MHQEERVGAAKQRFAPTPHASDFERSFAERYYAHVASGGTADVARFPAVLLKRRTQRLVLLALGLVSVLSLAILPSMTAAGDPGSWATDLAASWIAAAMVGVGPAAAATVASRRRLRLSIEQMQADRAAYVEHLHVQGLRAADTDQRLKLLGVDL